MKIKESAEAAHAAIDGLVAEGVRLAHEHTHQLDALKRALNEAHAKIDNLRCDLALAMPGGPEADAIRALEEACRREMWQSTNVPIRQAIERLDAVRATRSDAEVTRG